MSKPLVETKSLTKTFSRKPSLLQFRDLRPDAQTVTALNHVTLSLYAGQNAAITGPNGSGKTTLLKTLAGLVLPGSGTYRLAGSFYYVPAQDRSFYERLTGRENLDFFASLRKISRKETEKRTTAAAEALNLDFLNARYQELSTGMKQKLSIVRCLIMAPEIMLLDEPCRSLDAAFSASLWDYMRTKPSLLIYTTHHKSEAALAVRRFEMNAGILKELS